MTPAASASSPQGTAWRVLTIPMLGDLIEYGETQKIFEQPKDKRTEDYITGRFG